MSPTAETPLISFLLVVRNEVGLVGKCLRSMLNQTLDPNLYEILVIDGMSTDGTRAEVERISAEHPDRCIRLLDNPGLILSSGWNIGIRAARGQYVIRPDAHAEVPPDFLERNLAVMQAHPEATAVGGRLITVGTGFWGQVIAAVLSSRIGVGGSRFRIGGRAGPADTVVFGLYRRQALLDVGGFDESMSRNQDVACHARLRAVGAVLFFDPSICSSYYCRNTLGGLWRQMYNNGVHVIQMVAQAGWQTLRLRYLAPLVFVVGCVVLATFGAWAPALWGVLAGGLAVYLLLGWLVGILASLPLPQVLVCPAALLAMHLSYGLGELVGLMKLLFCKSVLGKHFANQ